MRSHTEAKQNEIYLGNQKGPIPEKFKSLKTLRLGDIAYDIHGDVLSRKKYNLRPLLIDRSEEKAYDDIMMTQFRAVAKTYTKSDT